MLNELKQRTPTQPALLANPKHPTKQIYIKLCSEQEEERKLNTLYSCIRPHETHEASAAAEKKNPALSTKHFIEGRKIKVCLDVLHLKVIYF